MSSRLKSLERRNLVLVLLTIGLGAWLFLRPDATTRVSKDDLPFVFPEFEKTEARRVELVQPAQGDRPERKIVLQLGAAGKWALESHFRYPLQAGADRLLDAIAAARLRSDVTRRKDTFAKYAGGEGWTEITVVGTRGETLLSFGLGRYAYPETFLRLGEGESAHVVKALNISTGVARVDPHSWIDTRLWPAISAANMIRMDVEQREEKRTLTFLRRGETEADLGMAAPAADPDVEKVFWMAAPTPGDAVKLAVEDLAREFSGMLIQDVIAGSLTSEDETRYGFDNPELVVTFFEKVGGKIQKHVLIVGKKIEGKAEWYVRRKATPWVMTIGGGTSFTRIRQAPEAFLPAAEPEIIAVPGSVDAPKDGDVPKDGDAPKDGAGSVPEEGAVASGDPDGDAPKAPDAPKDGDTPKK